MNRNTLNRRRFLKGIGLGTVGGIILGGSNFCVASTRTITDEQQGRVSQLYKKVTEPAKVSLIKGNNRRDIVYQSLKKIEDEVLSSIGDKKILIKPNMVLSDNPLCATHVDAIRAILDFFTPHYKKQIIIGESSVHKTFDGYKNYGYFALEKEYNVKLVDLNQDSFQYRYVFGEENRPLPVRIISTFLDPDVYIISAAQMKTHNKVLVTLSLKNVLLGCPLNDYKKNDKALFHTCPTSVTDFCHFNMFHIAQEVYPDLAVIDGFEAMEGNGPAWGTPFNSRIAIASLDALAADTLATKIMGFDPKRVLYLSAMMEAGYGQGEIERINVLGTPLNQCLYNFKPHEEM
ncbi:MAG: DUF362 domain-containing protein, partial [Bacteroidales bacterium]|nr:DUF362 domain-containing protein [Bacteroidales bacterium]